MSFFGSIGKIAEVNHAISIAHFGLRLFYVKKILGTGAFLVKVLARFSIYMA